MKKLTNEQREELKSVDRFIQEQGGRLGAFELAAFLATNADDDPPPPSAA